MFGLVSAAVSVSAGGKVDRVGFLRRIISKVRTVDCRERSAQEVAAASRQVQSFIWAGKLL